MRTTQRRDTATCPFIILSFRSLNFYGYASIIMTSETHVEIHREKLAKAHL